MAESRISLWPVFLLGAVLQGCAGPSPMPAGERGADPLQSVRALPFSGGAIHVLVEDVNEDGRVDVVATSHGANYSQAFLQQADGGFVAGPRAEFVGYHPNDIDPIGEGLYVSNGEGGHRLHVVRFGKEGVLEPVAELEVKAPRSTVAVDWPQGWGRVLAVSPYYDKTITLLAGARAAEGAPGREVRVEFERRVGHTLAADLDGDGVEEIIVPATHENKIWALAPGADPASPERHLLHDFKEHKHLGPELTVVDYNRDGRPDLLAAQASSSEMVLLRNDGGLRFTEVSRIKLPGVGPYHYTAARDENGRLVVALGLYHGFGLYVIDDAGQWSEPIVVGVSDWPVHLVLKDVDGDGAMDLVSAMKRVEDSVWVVKGPLLRAMNELALSGKEY